MESRCLFQGPVSRREITNKLFTFLCWPHYSPTSLSIVTPVQYHNLYRYVLGSNSTGYVSADLRLLSVEYSLFNYLPFNFCGDWVREGQYSNAPCPYDGTYSFNIPYMLPWDDGDLTTWFATGWQGYSDLIIYNNSTEHDDNQLLASCELHWKTYVTKTDESEGWKTLPSAAQAAIILAAIAVSMCLCCTWLACCRRRRRRKRHVTDADYAPGYVFNDGEPEPKTNFKKMLESSKERENRQKQEKEDMVHKINLNMKEPDWV